MKLTKEQVEQVKDEVVLFAQDQLGLGFGEADNMAETLLTDIVADIEETADWSDLESDEVCLGDITIAIGRVITKHLTKKKVFLLVTQWSNDDEQGSDCGVYATKELARKEMERDYNNMRNEFPNWEVYLISDDFAEIAMEGYYSCNHCDWQIKEVEVISE